MSETTHAAWKKFVAGVTIDDEPFNANHPGYAIALLAFDRGRESAARDEAVVKAEALNELAAHFNEPGITATSAGSIYIYESREHYDAGRPRPTEIVPWLRARADSLHPAPLSTERADQ